MSTYIPPGWTPERLETATAADLQTLPEEQLALIPLASIPITNRDARKFLKQFQISHADLVQRERLGLPPLPPSQPREQQPPAPREEAPEQFVQVVEEKRLDDFGFVVFRTTYTNEQAWERWQKEYDDLLEKSMDDCQGGGVQRVREKLLSSLVDDSDLDGMGLEGIPSAFAEIRENGDVPPGLDVGMCMVVDEAAMRSLLEPVEGQEPWVWAVDVHHEFTENQDESEYPGYFKVAISSLVPDLWPMLAGPEMPPQELWPFARPIWKSAV